MSTTNNRPRLVADIGGTNARFALADVAGRIYREQILAVADYVDIVAAITAYLHLAELADERAQDLPPALITERALAGSCSLCLTEVRW